MDIGRTGIWSIEFRTADPGEVRDAAAELDEHGWRALWVPGLGHGGVLDTAEQLLNATSRASIVVGVASIWHDDPVVFGRRHAQLRAASGGRLVSGLGVSRRESAESTGRVFGRPLAAMADYLDRMESSGHPIARNELLLAALGPKMLKLGRDRAGGVHPWLVTPEHTARSRQLLGPGPTLAPHQAVVFDADPDRARDTARKALGFFLGLASFQKNLRSLGFAESDLASGGSNRMIDALVVRGGGDAVIDAVANRVRRHHEAGADHVALHVIPSRGAGMPRREWRELGTLAT